MCSKVVCSFKPCKAAEGGGVVAENGSFLPWGFLLRRSSTSPGLHHFIPPPVKRDAYIKPHSEMENGASSDGRDPSGFLSEIIGAPVTVKLNSGVVYKGWLHYPTRNLLNLRRH